MKFIVGRKIEMSQIFKEDGKVIPVTLIQAGPCVVTDVRTNDKDGYSAIQIGYGDKKKVGKSVQGRIKDLNKNVEIFKEFRVEDEETESLNKGQEITVNVFEEGEKVKVTGESKGKGFAGVVKRYGFKGQSATHGTKDQLRMPGSSGATGPARVFKGKKNPGRMGGEQITVANLEVIKIDLDNDILYLKGAVPGARNSVISIYTEGIMDFSSPVVEEVKEENEAKDVNANETKETVKSEEPSEDKKVEEAKEGAKDSAVANAMEDKEVKVEEPKEEAKEEVKEEIKEEVKEETKEETK